MLKKFLARKTFKLNDYIHTPGGKRRGRRIEQTEAFNYYTIESAKTTEAIRSLNLKNKKFCTSKTSLFLLFKKWKAILRKGVKHRRL